ncbi:MAG TPA: AraC family transcriptional regulator [Verrucomicrobiae bacterium]|nr:AraC family transcriptional regulator [Verrucomicrobiae bacterium]
MNRAQPSQPAVNGAPEFFSPQVSAARRFYLNLNPPKRAPLSVVCGGSEHCAPEYAIHRATFPFYAIEYVVRGGASLRLNKHRRDLQPGAIFSYGPGVRHDIVAMPGDPPVKYFVNFAGVKSKEILLGCGLPPGAASQVFPPHGIQNLFDELIECGQRGSPRSVELCGKLLDCLTLKISEAHAPAPGTESLSFATYQHCRQHIERNFQQLKTLQQIAQECHVDSAYLCRLFQKFDHQTPYQFLMRLKMTSAAEWLRQPGALVKQVAERAGFNDQFHFSRAFKSVFGAAPDIFRRLR